MVETVLSINPVYEELTKGSCCDEGWLDPSNIVSLKYAPIGAERNFSQYNCDVLDLKKFYFPFIETKICNPSS